MQAYTVSWSPKHVFLFSCCLFLFSFVVVLFACFLFCFSFRVCFGFWLLLLGFCGSFIVVAAATIFVLVFVLFCWVFFCWFLLLFILGVLVGWGGAGSGGRGGGCWLWYDSVSAFEIAVVSQPMILLCPTFFFFSIPEVSYF